MSITRLTITIGTVGLSLSLATINAGGRLILTVCALITCSLGSTNAQVIKIKDCKWGNCGVSKDNLFYINSHPKWYKTDGSIQGTSDLTVSGFAGKYFDTYLFSFDGRLIFRAETGFYGYFSFYEVTNGALTKLADSFPIEGNFGSTYEPGWEVNRHKGEYYQLKTRHLDYTFSKYDLAGNLKKTIVLKSLTSVGFSYDSIFLGARKMTIAMETPVAINWTPLRSLNHSYGSWHLLNNDKALFKSDGTQPIFIQDFGNGKIDSVLRDNGELYISVVDLPASSTSLYAIAADLTVRHVFTQPGTSPVKFFSRIGGKMLFRVDALNETALWATDGTAANSEVIYRIEKNPPEGIVSSPLVFGEQLFFIGNRYEPESNPKGEAQLWRTNGTAAGTTIVTTSGPTFHSVSGPLCVFKDRIWYWGSDQLTGREVWSTSAAKGTQKLLRDINPGVLNSYKTADLVATDKYLFFPANQGGIGANLWVSQGQSDSTYRYDFSYNPAGGGLHHFAVVSNNVVFIRDSLARNSIPKSFLHGFGEITRPTAPFNPQQQPASTDSAAIFSWSHNSSPGNPVSFRIARKNNDGSFTAIGETSDLKFTDHGVDFNMPTVYKVVAFTPRGSSYQMVVTLPMSKPVAPGDFGFTKPPAGETATLQWTDKSFDEGAFEIEMQTGNLPFVKIRTVAPNATTAIVPFSISSSRYRMRAVNGAGASDYAEVQVLVTGLESNRDNKWRVYPNPVLEELFVYSPTPTLVNIRNMVGQVVRSITVSSGESVIDVADLPAGVYIIKLVDRTEVGSLLFIKE